MSNLDSIRKLILSQAVVGVGPGAEMCGNVQVCSTSKPAAKTNPFRPADAAVGRDAAIGTGRAAAGRVPGGTPKAAPGRSGMFSNVQECSGGDPFVKTNPPSGLTPRQVSAARWIVAGRSGRATARARRGGAYGLPLAQAPGIPGGDRAAAAVAPGSAGAGFSPPARVATRGDRLAQATTGNQAPIRPNPPSDPVDSRSVSGFTGSAA